MTHKLRIYIDYDIDHNVYCYKTDIKQDKVLSILEDYMVTQIGAGSDRSKTEERDLYSIDITLDLSDDSFHISHNCGNKSLREGILIMFMQKLNKEAAEQKPCGD